MCAALDMLSSEQLFYGRSPPAGFLAEYAPPRRQHKHAARGHSAPCLSVSQPARLALACAPRSCLRTPADRKKKRVVFADDRGFALEQVKFMTEPSHLPPHWALRVLASPTPDRPPARPAPDLWETRFVQPASDYLEFRRRITEDCVSLENVIVKQDELAADGTVKVKNIAFSKEVFVRSSSDGWRTHEDTYCAFVESGPAGGGGGGGAPGYDTFGFRLQLPLHSRRLDFCVGFRCRGDHFWDSNAGKNYTVEKSSARSAPALACARINYGNSWSGSAVGGSTPYW